VGGGRYSLSGYGAAETWTVTKNADGTYSFANGGQNIGLAAEFSSMQLGAVNDDWQVISLGGSLYNIKNTGRGNFMEWYNEKDNWSTYNSDSAASDDQFQLSFYVIGKGIVEESGSGNEGGNQGGNEGGDVTPPAGGDISNCLLNGDQVVIFAPAYGKALSADKVAEGSYYNKGVDVTLTNGTLSGYGAAETWTVIKNADGSYSFANGGKNIALASGYSSMQLGEVNDDWQVISLGGSLYNIKNTGRGNFMEWYNEKDNWSTYNSDSAATDDQFQLSFYVIGKGILEEAGSGNEGGNQGGTVTPPAGGDQGGSDVEMVAAATITFDDTAKRTSVSEEQQVWEENGIVFTNEKTATSSPINGEYFKPVRCYKGSKVTVAYEGMLKIAFDCNYSTYTNYLKQLLGSACTVEGNIVTVEFASAQDTYVIESLTTGQVRFSSITVYTAA